MAKSKDVAKNEPIGTAKAVERLKLFNEKIRTLRDRNFIRQVFNPNHGITFEFDSEKPPTFERLGADEEALHAVATTLRFFVQPRDGIDLEQMAAMYQNLPVEDMAKRSARRAVDILNAYLDSSTGVVLNGRTITRRQLFDVIFYGSIVHANIDKRLEFETWMRDPAVDALLRTFFEETIARMISTIVSFYAMNDRTIKLLESVP